MTSETPRQAGWPPPSPDPRKQFAAPPAKAFRAGCLLEPGYWGERSGIFARADTVRRGSGFRPQQGCPAESGPLPLPMVLLQHVIILVLRLLLSCDLWFVFDVAVLRSSFRSSVKEKRERQDRFYYNTTTGPLGP